MFKRLRHWWDIPSFSIPYEIHSQARRYGFLKLTTTKQTNAITKTAKQHCKHRALLNQYKIPCYYFRYFKKCPLCYMWLSFFFFFKWKLKQKDIFLLFCSEKLLTSRVTFMWGKKWNIICQKAKLTLLVLSHLFTMLLIQSTYDR